MTSNAYADGNGPSYAYSLAGRLATRTWARGVTTSYSYDNAGSLANTMYSDGTPAVTNNYDRLGRLYSVTCAGSTNIFTYDLANDVLAESYSGGILNGLLVTNGFDLYLRRTNLSVFNGASLLASTTY